MKIKYLQTMLGSCLFIILIIVTILKTFKQLIPQTIIFQILIKITQKALQKENLILMMNFLKYLKNYHQIFHKFIKIFYWKLISIRKLSYYFFD